MISSLVATTERLNFYIFTCYKPIHYILTWEHCITNYDWSVIHSVVLIMVGKCVVRDRVKGIHDFPHVLVTHSVMTASLALEVTWSKCFNHVQADARCD